jgi:hypothetical protein
MKRRISNMKNRYTSLVAAGLLLVSAVPLLAHHSISSEFTPLKEWSISGTLVRVDWINPHTATWVEAKDPQTGAMHQYGCEGAPPATLHRAGMKKDDWKIGEPVVLTCAAAKDGTPYWGFIHMIKYKADGRVMVFRIGGE